MKGRVIKKRRMMDRVSHFTTLIGQKTHINGRIISKDNCIVYGQIKGQGQIDSVLMVGENGSWEGDFTASDVIVSGNVNGNVSVENKLEITRTARINGKLSCPVVAIEEGAVHIGEINMGKVREMVHYQERRERNKTQAEADPITSESDKK